MGYGRKMKFLLYYNTVVLFESEAENVEDFIYKAKEAGFNAQDPGYLIEAQEWIAPYGTQW